MCCECRSIRLHSALRSHRSILLLCTWSSFTRLPQEIVLLVLASPFMRTEGVSINQSINSNANQCSSDRAAVVTARSPEPNEPVASFKSLLYFLISSSDARSFRSCLPNAGSISQTVGQRPALIFNTKMRSLRAKSTERRC